MIMSVSGTSQPSVSTPTFVSICSSCLAYRSRMSCLWSLGISPYTASQATPRSLKASAKCNACSTFTPKTTPRLPSPCSKYVSATRALRSGMSISEASSLTAKSPVRRCTHEISSPVLTSRHRTSHKYPAFIIVRIERSKTISSNTSSRPVLSPLYAVAVTPRRSLFGSPDMNPNSLKIFL